eukprot:6589261-Prymnesium_polylepis.1
MQLTFMLAQALSKDHPAARERPLHVPLVIFVQRLVRFHKGGTIVSLDLLREYIAADHQEHQKVLEMALEMRTLVLVLDGIDEAGGLKSELETFVFRQLLSFGLRLVVTSRPVGVQLGLYTERFVMMNLKPLSVEQQKRAVAAQLNYVGSKGKEYHDRLMALAEVRMKHDAVYKDAFSPEQRRLIEDLNAPDQMYLPDGSTPHPESRLPLPQEVPQAGVQPSPASEYLKDLCANALTPALLTKLDELLSELPSHSDRNEVLSAVASVITSVDKRSGALASKLSLLLMRRRHRPLPSYPDAQTASELWCRIVERTDAVYQQAAEALPVYEQALQALCVGHSSNCGVKVQTKDPIHLHRKALHNYFGRYDSGLPEACVSDVLRARVAFEAPQLDEFLGKLLSAGASVAPQLELIHLQNHFRSLEATRFRYLVCTFRLRFNGTYFLCELQVHHPLLLSYHEESHAQDHYSFFRRLLASRTYEDGLDRMLDRMLAFLDEVMRVPVLLSMLVLVFATRTQATSAELPVDRYSLYDIALRCSITLAAAAASASPEETPYLCALPETDVLNMLKRIATANQQLHRREFDADNVVHLLADYPQDARLWEELQKAGNVPLVKLLDDGAQPARKKGRR